VSLRIYRAIIKPLADFVSAFVLLIVLFPFVASTAILLLFANKGKVFFIQKRPGLNAQPFNIIKFKTMCDAFDKDGFPLPDEVRLTTVGKFIRSASLDELLQLINVLKGDMSLVGPRPLLMQYIPHYSKEQARRHEVKPGITGWAQVNGRNAISWEGKFRLDVEYVDKQSFWMDVKILWMTIVNVLQRKGISADGHMTMQEFKGSE
jgi:lipopolysaccharide/colanic/teichoic acid biosynthesis glycosyltransferase